MYCISQIWKRLTQKSLEQSSGKLETAFFESVYRISYASGLSPTEYHGLFYKVYSNMIRVFIFLFLASEFWYLFEVSHSLDSVIDNINVTIIHLITMYRYKSMVDYKQVFKKLAESMDSHLFDINTPARKKILEYWYRANNKYYKLLLTLASCTLTVWYIYPLLDEVEYNFVCTIRLPVEYRSYNRYIVAYLLTTLLFHYISCFVVVNDLTMQTHLIHLLCQYVVLSNCFENILVECGAQLKKHDQKLYKDPHFRRRYLKRLGELVEQHKYILSNSTDLRTIFSKPMLGQLAASGLLICFAGYQVTATVASNKFKFLMSALYLAYNMSTFYLICRWCDEIKMQSENIRQSVYFSGWEDGMSVVPGVKIRLMLVISRASRPLVLTAGGIYDVSLSSYTTLVKTSYSALTVLLRMRQL